MEEQIPTNEPEEQMTPTVGGNVVPAPVLCGEEWCVAVGNCDGRHPPMLNGEVCDTCTECGEPTDEQPMWCSECDLEAVCPNCWNGCPCYGDDE